MQLSNLYKKLVSCCFVIKDTGLRKHCGIEITTNTYLVFTKCQVIEVE